MTDEKTERTTAKDGGAGKMTRAQKLRRIVQQAVSYWNGGIWADTRNTWQVNSLKTINLSVTSFFNTDLQTQAAGMTYRTTLAIVPALALLFAIGRGFGLQAVIQDELNSILPGQKFTIDKAMSFVDGYLNQSSEGVFVGIGLVFLLWTLISLVSSVEDTFNKVWGVSQGRSFWRKMSDYTALLLILPVLMICASGLTLFVSSTLQKAFDFEFMTPLISVMLEIASWIMTWLFFAACYKLIPNTKVKIVNALIAGVIAGTGFRVLQWLFITGQLYVTKYNAIYGSFAFLPLLLLWVYLTWMVTLCGALICYASQNIFLYAMSSQVRGISPDYGEKVTVAVMTMLVKDFTDRKPPMSAIQISEKSDIPPRLVTDVLNRLCDAGLAVRVILNPKVEVYSYQPAVEPGQLTLGMLRDIMSHQGKNDFISGFGNRFCEVVRVVDEAENKSKAYADGILLKDIEIGELLCKVSDKE